MDKRKIKLINEAKEVLKLNGIEYSIHNMGTHFLQLVNLLNNNYHAN